ncbi:hypothetical protein [Rhizobium sp. YTU87027]|uniref:hypothetical protein n=1 Tax=Rhizobium sp. YTU87027 TaxID=3417741 RepID=UPI003D68A3E7
MTPRRFAKGPGNAVDALDLVFQEQLTAADNKLVHVAIWGVTAALDGDVIAKAAVVGALS